MHKRIVFIAAVLMIVVLTGCSLPEVKVNITSPMEFYSPMMSSVPGFPIDIDVEVSLEETDEISIEMETDNGTLLEWGSDMKVNDKGKSVLYHDGTRYWSPFDEELGIVQAAEIKIRVTVKAPGYLSIIRKKIKIEINSEGMYVLVISD